MSFLPPDAGITVGGVSASVSAGPAVGDASTGDVLAFTGTGPGTFYLAIIGFLTLITGALMSVFGRRSRRDAVAQAPVNGLADLSPLATRLGPRVPEPIAWVNPEPRRIVWRAQT